jgi:phage I-like protein
MLSAHNHAVTEGYQADTPEYFAYVESQLGYRPQQRAMPSRSAPPAAPSSAAASSSGGNKNLVRLSPEERETASLFGMTPEEYAKNKMALKKEGKIN